MNELESDQEKYPNRYVMGSARAREFVGENLKSEAQQYLQEWHTKGYTGNYIPEQIRDGFGEKAEWNAQEAEAEVDADWEERATDPVTGGQKGRKLEEFALVPVWPRQEVARVYGMGAKKYEPNNWRRGYPWSWSISAAYRHLAKFESGESIDPESGLHHLAHASFHLNSLMEFERLGSGTDDRQF